MRDAVKWQTGQYPRHSRQPCPKIQAASIPHLGSRNIRTSAFATRKGNTEMQPLTPRDLLIRHQPVDVEEWFDGPEGSEKDSAAPVVPLERFQALEHIIRDSPINVDPYIELARIYLQNKRWADAKRVLDLAVQRFPEDEDANFLREEAQLARSLELLRDAQTAHQEEPTKLTKEALDRCHLELNVLREKICRSRLTRHPEQLELNMPLAVALENLGQRDEAIQCLQLAIADAKLRSRAAYQLGQTFERAKRIPEALSAYRRAALFRIPAPAMDLKVAALAAAANLAQKSGLIDSARRYVEMLLELQPNNPAVKQRLEELKELPL